MMLTRVSQFANASESFLFWSTHPHAMMETRSSFAPAAAPRSASGTCGTPCLHSTFTSWPKQYAEPCVCGRKTVVFVLACSNATSRVAPKETATVQFCVLALSYFTAAASW